jgi:hypothetical protein
VQGVHIGNNLFQVRNLRRMSVGLPRGRKDSFGGSRRVKTPLEF